MRPRGARWALVLGVAAAIGGAAAACFSDRNGGVTALSASCQAKAKAASVAEGAVVVGIENFSFKPTVTTIPRGKTVTWINCESTAGLGHTVTSDAGGQLASTLILPGQTYTKTFTGPGTYAYHCEPHPTMKGQVVVE